MVIQKTIWGGECASARVNEWVSEYVIRWPICFSAVWNVLKDLVGSGIVWFGLDRRLLSQAIRISFFILYVYKCYPLLLYVFCLLVWFDSLPPINDLSVKRGFLAKLGLMCLAQGHNAVMPMRLEPEAPRSPVKHSTTEPLRSLYVCLVCIILKCFQGFKGKTRPRKCIVDIEKLWM